MVGGELVTALAEATDARIIPVDSEHSALFQLIGAERPGPRGATGPHRLGRSVPGPHRPLRRDAGGGARAPHLGDGRQDHDRLGDPDQQGLRADRGASPVRARRTSGSTSWSTRSRSSTRSSTSTTAPRSPISAIPTCGCRSPTRSTTPSAPTSTCRPSTWPRSASSRFEEPDLETFPCLRLAREAGEAGGTAPCVLNAADEVAVEAFLGGRIPFTAIAEVVERTLEALPAATPGHFEDLYAATPRLATMPGR